MSSELLDQLSVALDGAAVVLVAAAVVYEMVIPSTHIERTRLARLVPTTSGLSVFAKSTPQGAEQNDTQTGLVAVTAAAKKSPDRTGIYSIAWSASQTSAGGVIAFLSPDVATAQATLPQIESQQMGATTYAANSLDRKATGTVAGLPGSHTAMYEPSAKAPKGTPSLAITEFPLWPGGLRFGGGGDALERRHRGRISSVVYRF